MRLDPILIVPHDTSWAKSFQEQRMQLEVALAPLLRRPIEHIGSTAVPGLAAKPIVDMLAVVGDIDEMSAALPGVLALGWLEAPEPGDTAARRRSLCFPSVERRSHHLHVVEARSEGWPGWLAFRDRLRENPDVAVAYAALKQRLADRYGAVPNERNAYRAGKRDFIAYETAQALSGRSTIS